MPLTWKVIEGKPHLRLENNRIVRIIRVNTLTEGKISNASLVLQLLTDTGWVKLGSYLGTEQEAYTHMRNYAEFLFSDESCHTEVPKVWDGKPTEDKGKWVTTSFR